VEGNLKQSRQEDRRGNVALQITVVSELELCPRKHKEFREKASSHKKKKSEGDKRRRSEKKGRTFLGRGRWGFWVTTEKALGSAFERVKVLMFLS